MELSDARRLIDGIDERIVDLFAERMRLVLVVRAEKEAVGLSVRQAAREEEILDKVSVRAVSAGIPGYLIRKIYACVLAEMVHFQTGVEG